MSQYVGIKPKEVFIGNCDDPAVFAAKHPNLQTVRFGKVALDINGKRLPGYSAIFLAQAELPTYNANMERQLKAIREGRQA